MHGHYVSRLWRMQAESEREIETLSRIFFSYSALIPKGSSLRDQAECKEKKMNVGPEPSSKIDGDPTFSRSV